MAGYTSVFIIVLLSIGNIESKYIEGVLETKEDWTFLTRFCLLSRAGSFQYAFQYPVEYGTQEVLMYYDTPLQWDMAYGSSLSCEEKRNLLNPLNNQIISLNTSDTWTSRHSGCEGMKGEDGSAWYNCSGGRTFRSSRERWWYFAICRCGQAANQPVGLKLHYQMHLTNGEPGDLLHYEFSADEFYILPIDIAFFIAYFIMLGFSIACAVALSYRQLFHTTYKIYLVSLITYAFYLLLMCVAYGSYASTGREQRGTKIAGRAFLAVAQLTFLLMLILMAKGFTISRGRLPTHSVVKLTIFFCIYIVVYAVLYVWESSFSDPGRVLYLYESPPGYGLLAMKLIGWVWFLYSIFFTLKRHHDKKSLHFYIPFLVFFLIWFWADPIVIIVAMRAMELWTREKTVTGVEHLVALCGHLFFLILTRPQAANKNFPYHVRTSQIGILGAGDNYSDGSQGGSSGSSEMNSPYPYAPTDSGTGPDFSSLFIVSQTHGTGEKRQPRRKESPESILPPLYPEAGPSELPSTGEASTIEASAPPSYEALFRASNSQQS